MWSPVSVCKGIDWRQEEKWGEKSTKVTKERGGKKEARSENKVVKIKSKLMRWWWCCFPLHLNPLHLLWRKINKTMEIRCVCACVCLCEKDWELCCFAISVYMHPCSCVSVYVFVFLWACGRALHPYIFLTSGWTLMGHALHTAPSGCACMYVCVHVCVSVSAWYSTCIQTRFLLFLCVLCLNLNHPTCRPALFFYTSALSFSLSFTALWSLLPTSVPSTQSNHRTPLSHHLSIVSSGTVNCLCHSRQLSKIHPAWLKSIVVLKNGICLCEVVSSGILLPLLSHHFLGLHWYSWRAHIHIRRTTRTHGGNSSLWSV